MKRSKKLRKLADKLYKLGKITFDEHFLMCECSAELNNIVHESEDPLQTSLDNWFIDEVRRATEGVLLYPLPDEIHIWGEDFQMTKDCIHYALYEPINHTVIAPPVYVGINRWVFENEYRVDKKITVIGKYQMDKTIKIYQRRFYKDLQELYDYV